MIGILNLSIWTKDDVKIAMIAQLINYMMSPDAVWPCWLSLASDVPVIMKIIDTEFLVIYVGICLNYFQSLVSKL